MAANRQMKNAQHCSLLEKRNQNYNEAAAPHTSQNGRHQKVYKQTLGALWSKASPPTQLVGMLVQPLWQRVQRCLKTWKESYHMIPQPHSRTNMQRKVKTLIQKLGVHPNIRNSTMNNSQDMETTQVTINRELAYKGVIYLLTHTMEYYSTIKNKEIVPFATTLMNLKVK